MAMTNQQDAWLQSCADDLSDIQTSVEGIHGISLSVEQVLSDRLGEIASVLTRSLWTQFKTLDATGAVASSSGSSFIGWPKSPPAYPFKVINLSGGGGSGGGGQGQGGGVPSGPSGGFVPSGLTQLVSAIQQVTQTSRVIVGSIQRVTGVVNAARGIAEQANAANRRLIGFSGQIAHSQFQLALGDMGRNFSQAKATQQGAAELANAVNGMRDNFNQLEIERIKMSNLLGKEAAEAAGPFGKVFARMMQGINGKVEKNKGAGKGIGGWIAGGWDMLLDELKVPKLKEDPIKKENDFWKNFLGQVAKAGNGPAVAGAGIAVPKVAIGNNAVGPLMPQRPVRRAPNFQARNQFP